MAVFDYGSGNLRSAERALAATGARVSVTSDLARARAADGLVLPGVGAFSACMAGLSAAGGDDLVLERAREGRPVLAVCVGHQILFERGVEHGAQTAGCGLWPAAVDRLTSERLPHMGWNTVQAAEGSRLFADVEDERFYFVHSFGVHDAKALTEAEPEARLTWAEHDGDRFLAAVESGSVCSTQFHPEKSGEAGARLLRNWVATLTD